MELYFVTALKPVEMTVDYGDDQPPANVALLEGGGVRVRRVIRLRPDGSAASDIVPHPADLSHPVQVSGAIEIVRVK